MFYVLWNEYWGEWRVINGRTGYTVWEFVRSHEDRALAYAERRNKETH